MSMNRTPCQRICATEPGTEVIDFPDADDVCPEVGGTVQPNGRCNFEGIPLIFAPEWKGTLFGSYETDRLPGDWALNVRADINYSSAYFVELNYFENLQQDDYVTVNASAALVSPDRHWTLRVFGKNLTEEYILAWGLEAGPSRFTAPSVRARPEATRPIPRHFCESALRGRCPARGRIVGRWLRVGVDAILPRLAPAQTIAEVFAAAAPIPAAAAGQTGGDQKAGEPDRPDLERLMDHHWNRRECRCR